MRTRHQFLLSWAAATVSLVGLVLVVEYWPMIKTDVSRDRPYRDLIGAEYRIVADDVHAYGISEGWPGDKTVTEISLIPGIGIGGGEVAFRKPVPKGAVIKILSAWHRPMLFDNGHYYLSLLRAPTCRLVFPSKLSCFAEMKAAVPS